VYKLKQTPNIFDIHFSAGWSLKSFFSLILLTLILGGMGGAFSFMGWHQTDVTCEREPTQGHFCQVTFKHLGGVWTQRKELHNVISVEQTTNAKTRINEVLVSGLRLTSSSGDSLPLMLGKSNVDDGFKSKLIKDIQNYFQTQDPPLKTSARAFNLFAWVGLPLLALYLWLIVTSIKSIIWKQFLIIDTHKGTLFCRPKAGTAHTEKNHVSRLKELRFLEGNEAFQLLFPKLAQFSKKIKGKTKTHSSDYYTVAITLGFNDGKTWVIGNTIPVQDMKRAFEDLKSFLS